jgi:hypothetical protein
MDPVVLTVFFLVYLGMMLGEIPGLALDRGGSLFSEPLRWWSPGG